MGVDSGRREPLRLAGGETVTRSRSSFRAVWVALLSSGLPTLVACGGGPEPHPPAPRDTIVLVDSTPLADTDATIDTSVTADTSATADAAAWIAGVVDLPAAGAGVGTLASVRAARHEGFDRVVWEFSGGSAPGVHVEYVDKPVRQCGSGEPVPLPGDGWLEVRLEPARAHTELGRPTMAARRQTLALPIVIEIVQTCDFEAVVTWVLATPSPERFRLSLLDDPPRVVVDVRHGSR